MATKFTKDIVLVDSKIVCNVKEMLFVNFVLIPQLPLLPQIQGVVQKLLFFQNVMLIIALNVLLLMLARLVLWDILSKPMALVQKILALIIVSYAINSKSSVSFVKKDIFRMNFLVLNASKYHLIIHV